MTALTELIQTAEMLETYAADCFPANEQGQVHFARAMMESAAPALRAADAEINRLRSALMDTACSVAALKRPCGMDPESAGAIRNGQYMSIALAARDSLTPKEMTPTKKPRRGDAGADIAQEPPSPQRDEPGAYHADSFAQGEITDAEMLRRMREASDTFYRLAVQTRVHPFLEFTGLINEYIQCCEAASQQGIDFASCNKHAGNQLPMPGHAVDYVNEKLACIFTGRSVMKGSP